MNRANPYKEWDYESIEMKNNSSNTLKMNIIFALCLHYHKKIRVPSEKLSDLCIIAFVEREYLIQDSHFWYWCMYIHIYGTIKDKICHELGRELMEVRRRLREDKGKREWCNDIIINRLIKK